MDTRTEEILEKDSIADTERILGDKHWSKFNNLENAFSIGNIIRDNEIKEEHLKSLKDTYFSMSWRYFKNLIQEKGFVNGYTYEIDYDNWGNPRKEEAIIYYHPQKGLIIWATSYNSKTTVNGGNLYGEIKSNSKEDEKVIWRWLSSGGCTNAKEMIWKTSHDIREGLFSKLDTLESAGEFLNKWTNKDTFLWFVDYAEDKLEGYDYKKITNEKINKCPIELQNIIGIRD